MEDKSIEPIKVGDYIFINKGKYIQALKVVRIGRKYLYTEQYKDKPICKENLTYTSDYISSSFKAYRTEQEILDIKERGYLLHEIRTLFSLYGSNKEISLEKLREIHKILEINEKK